MLSETIVARVHNAGITALALICTYALAFVWNLDNPFWAAFTVFMVSLPTIGQSLQKGLLRTLGTLLGTAVALLLFAFFSQERLLLLGVLTLYMSLMLGLMTGNRINGYFFYIASLVTMIIVLMASTAPQEAFHLAVYRTEETLLGITVYTLITLLIEPRSSLRNLRESLESMGKAHGELFDMDELADKKERMHRMFALYTTMKERLDTLELLVPAVRLENYQVYRNAAYWREAIRLSGELLERQRRWTGTLVAMQQLDIQRFFPEFSERRRELGELLHALETPTAPIPADLPRLNYSAQDDLEPTAQGLAATVRELFRDQVGHCLRLRALLAFLLYDAPAPALTPVRKQTRAPLFTPARRANIGEFLLLFWITIAVWIFFNPPGLDSARFPELTILLGLSGLFTGMGNPLALVAYYLVGILCTGVLYLFVYPALHSLGLFMLITFIIAFGVVFLFPRREQGAMKMGFMMPWLAIGNFTNTPTYSFLALSTGSVMLLTGISLIALIHYVFYTPNIEAKFLARQNAFFRTAHRILQKLTQAPTPQTGSFRRFWNALREELLLRRLSFLSSAMEDLIKEMPVQVMQPEVARLFSTETRDITASLRLLCTEYASLYHIRRNCPCCAVPNTSERMACSRNSPQPSPGNATQNRTDAPEGVQTLPSPQTTAPLPEGSLSIDQLAAAENLIPSSTIASPTESSTFLEQHLKDLFEVTQNVMKKIQTEEQGASGEKEEKIMQTMRAQCGGLLRALTTTLEVARTTPWVLHTDNRF